MSSKIESYFGHAADIAQELDTTAVGRLYLESPEKRYLDQRWARIMKPVAAPIIAVARLAVWAEDGAPTIVSIPRVGKAGELFLQSKVRSMVPGSEKQAPSSGRKVEHDPRITTVGKLLRRTSIDELPQIGNVQRGDMSLVGPRPKPQAEFELLCGIDDSFAPSYTLAAPGMTGLEQINGRADLGPAERIGYTQQYAAEACLALDIDILRKTVGVVRNQHGAY